MEWRLFVCVYVSILLTRGAQAQYWVDGNSGDDSNPGSEDRPFKTITRARDEIRHIKNTTGLPTGGITVTMRPADYPYIDGPLELTAEDSGTIKCPIMYTGFIDVGGVHITAGIKPKWDTVIAPIQDKYVRDLLKESVKDKIVQIDLKQLGITDYGEIQSGQLGDCANNKLDLFGEDMNMILARYPNIDQNGRWQWLSAGKVIDKQKSFDFSTNSSVANHIISWRNTSTLWLHGYWSFDWADNYVKVESIDTKNTTFVVSQDTPPVYGFVANARYYALNILEELDTENEYYIDRGSGILYLFESTAQKLAANDKGCVSVGETAISVKDVSYLYFIAIEVDCARSTAVSLNNVNNVTMVDFVVHDVGGSGLSITGYNNTLSGVSVIRTGCGGIHMSGGDQKLLRRGDNILGGSKIADWSNWKRTYQPALSWSGVGNTYINNKINNGPHAGILGGGNDCVFENNELDTLCYETSDSGAFYSGRSWIDRGNIIRGNTFKNVRNTETPHLGSMSVQAIYLDDQMSGYTIVNNKFFNCHCGTFIGGGRRNLVQNNFYQTCSLAVHVDDRGLTWQKEDCEEGGMFDQQLKSVNWQQPPWSTHYPELVNIFQDHPCVPAYNNISHNEYCRSTFIDITVKEWNQWLTIVDGNTNTC